MAAVPEEEAARSNPHRAAAGSRTAADFLRFDHPGMDGDIIKAGKRDKKSSPANRCADWPGLVGNLINLTFLTLCTFSVLSQHFTGGIKAGWIQTIQHRAPLIS